MTSRRALASRLLAWAALAALVTAPGILHLSTRLVGDPRIDVWNHAWGYWFVAQALAHGHLPWATSLAGGPAGGVLYFIDTPGALLWTPVTWLFGPAVAYGLSLAARVAMAGFAAQLLAEELVEPGPPGWLAGIAYATTPFLLCELANGISEVCATGWLPLSLWAAARALRAGRRRDWLALGLLLGATSVVTFYYGLVACLLVALLAGGTVVARLRRSEAVGGILAGGGAAAALAAALVLPHWLAFRASLAAPGALIRRPPGLDAALLAHNAVDPRAFLAPGSFQSVDLATIYGEPFVHTGFLRLSVVALAILGVLRLRRLRPWLLLALASIVLGLGSYLWWGGDWVRAGGRVLSLPFSWLRAIMPQVAITHPLRLSLGAQAIFPVLAAGGLAELLRGLRGRASRAALCAGLAALVVAETVFASAARWPLPSSDATVPSAYARAPEGMVLDLPVEVGTTMESSRYFWYQTVHHRPIPFTPDVRLGSQRDAELVPFFAGSERGSPQAGLREHPSAPSPGVLEHLRRTYGMVVLHPELERRAKLPASYLGFLSEALGPPSEEDGLLVWRLR